MKNLKFYFRTTALASFILSSFSFAGSGVEGMPNPEGIASFAGLPNVVRTQVISRMLDVQDHVHRFSDVNRQCYSEKEIVLTQIRRQRQANALKKVAQIEALMEKYGKWIDLPPALNPTAHAVPPVGQQIASFPNVQELWVEIMGSNPSHFKDRKYCPESYREVTVNGVMIPMCPDFQMDRVIAINQHQKDSDVEFYEQINQIYKTAGLPDQFSRSNRAQWNYADTEGGVSPKLEAQAQLRPQDPNFLGRYTPYYQISDKNPSDLTQRSASGKHQPRSIFENAPNALEFRRGGNWEWVEDINGSLRGLVGGSFSNYPKNVASGYQGSDRPDFRWLLIGPSRLLRTR